MIVISLVIQLMLINRYLFCRWSHFTKLI